MPTFDAKKEYLRVLEYNFWKYQYVTRKFMVEVVYGGRFGDDNRIVIPENKAEAIETEEYYNFLGGLFFIHGFDAFDDESPEEISIDDFTATDKMKIRATLNAWHDYISLKGGLFGADLSTRVSDYFKTFNDMGINIQEVIAEIYSYCKSYGYHAYALPGVTKIASTFLSMYPTHMLDELDFDGLKKLYPDWVELLLESSQMQQIQSRDLFLPNKVDNNIWSVGTAYNNEKIGTKKYRELMQGFYESSLSRFQNLAHELEGHGLLVICMDITWDNIKINKALASIDRVVDAIKIDGNSQHKFYTIDNNGKRKEYETIGWDKCRQSSFTIMIDTCACELKKHGLKNIIKGRYLHTVMRFGFDLRAQDFDAYALFVKQSYCDASFVAGKMTRLIGLWLWDCLYFNSQQWGKVELAEAIKELRISSDVVTAPTPDAPPIVSLLLSYSEHDDTTLRRAFREACLSIAKGDVLSINN